MHKLPLQQLIAQNGALFSFYFVSDFPGLAFSPFNSNLPVPKEQAHLSFFFFVKISHMTFDQLFSSPLESPAEVPQP